MTMPISLEGLQALDAIDRRGSFAAAAEELHRVPSAVSYTVQRMEQLLGVELFDRRRQRARLTAAGQVVLEQGRAILAASDALTRTAREVHQGWEAELRIAVDSIFPLEPLYPLLEAFQRDSPHTRLTLREEVLGGTWESLAHGRSDLVIGATSRPGFSDVRTRPIGDVDWAFVCAPDHPLARAVGPVPPERIRPYRAVAVADTSRHGTPLTAGLLEDQPTLTVPSMQAKIEAHEAGLGVGFLARHLAAGALRDDRLHEVPLANPRPAATAWLGWRGSHHGRALGWFLDALDPPTPFAHLLHP